MAKKGATAQLQAEINNDEEFDRFLEKYPEALYVLDVYTEWCGPCLGAVNQLRKIKMELGGDDLQLAICKSDTITRLHRFYRKSEPSWLFVRGGKSINLMLGSDIPQLLEVIKFELKRLSTPLHDIGFIEIEDLHPEEQKRLHAKTSAAMAIEKKERTEREKKRRDYLMYCTDSILENLPDVGVTIFGPQVTRDMFRKINEPADALKIACKDKRFQYVTKADFDIINFACKEPLLNDVIEELTKHELLLCYWKVGEEAKGTVPQVMQRYVHELTKRVVEPPDDFNTQERVLPPILTPIKVKVEYEVEPEIECPSDDDDDEKPKPRISEKPEKVKEVKEVKVEEELLAEADFEGEEEEEGEAGGIEQGGGFDAPPPADMNLGMNFGDTLSDEVEEEEEEEIIIGPPPKKYCTKTVVLPPVWTASDERTQAALVYVFFRVQTLPFLEPDPPPEPPHVIMAFDTYKKRDLISIAERNKDEIPAYGFFTSDDAEDATFIANSAQKYAHHPASASDKLVFKVNKRTSQMMLSLASYGATYVSPNPTIGKEEALKFFPEGYRTAEQDRLEALEAQKRAKDEQPAEEKPTPVAASKPVKGKAAAKGKEKDKEDKAAVKFETEAEAPEGMDMEDYADESPDEGEADEGYGEGDEIGKVAPADEGGEPVAETAEAAEEDVAGEEEEEAEANAAEAE